MRRGVPDRVAACVWFSPQRGRSYEAVESDGVFYGRSGGGMTLSGGEPLLQSEFAVALLREARRRRIGTAIETCGHVEWPVLKDAAELCNTVFFDVKCVSAAKHKEFTGVDNTLILSNLRKLVAGFPRLSIVVRTPLIPGFNDSVEDISAIIEVLRAIAGSYLRGAAVPPPRYSEVRVSGPRLSVRRCCIESRNREDDQGTGNSVRGFETRDSMTLPLRRQTSVGARRQHR